MAGAESSVTLRLQAAANSRPEGSAMSVVKDFRFPVTVRHLDGRRTLASAPEKPELEIATPPEFKEGIPGVWSPEDLLTTAAASCYAVTLLAVAEHSGVPVRGLQVDGAGHVTRRQDGRFGFVAVELAVAFETDAELVEKAERVADKAKQVCIVTMALDLPVHVSVHVQASALEGVI
jgi:organic hydroperoxide reductase OsmC/OhrA